MNVAPTATGRPVLSCDKGQVELAVRLDAGRDAPTRRSPAAPGPSRHEPERGQPGGLLQAEGHVRCLDRLSGASLHELSSAASATTYPSGRRSGR